MGILNHLDDIGIYLLCRPINFLRHIDLVNLFDDIGIVLIIRPLGYLYRLAEILVVDTDSGSNRSLDSTWSESIERRTYS
jgi:hypothetical protein